MQARKLCIERGTLPSLALYPYNKKSFTATSVAPLEFYHFACFWFQQEIFIALDGETFLVYMRLCSSLEVEYMFSWSVSVCAKIRLFFIYTRNSRNENWRIYSSGNKSILRDEKFVVDVEVIRFLMLKTAGLIQKYLCSITWLTLIITVWPVARLRTNLNC